MNWDQDRFLGKNAKFLCPAKHGINTLIYNFAPNWVLNIQKKESSFDFIQISMM